MVDTEDAVTFAERSVRLEYRRRARAARASYAKTVGDTVGEDWLDGFEVGFFEALVATQEPTAADNVERSYV